MTNHTVTFRYILGPKSLFAQDDEVTMQNATVTVGGVPVEGVTIERCTVVDDGTALEFRVTLPDSMFGELSIQ